MERTAAELRGALLFPSDTGTVLDYRNLLTRAMTPTPEQAGAPWAGFHTFRHTAGSMLIAQGRSIVQVSRRLGHHSPAFTLQVYAHTGQPAVASGCHSERHRDHPEHPRGHERLLRHPERPAGRSDGYFFFLAFTFRTMLILKPAPSFTSGATLCERTTSLAFLATFLGLETFPSAQPELLSFVVAVASDRPLSFGTTHGIGGPPTVRRASAKAVGGEVSFDWPISR